MTSLKAICSEGTVNIWSLRFPKGRRSILIHVMTLEPRSKRDGRVNHVRVLESSARESEGQWTRPLRNTAQHIRWLFQSKLRKCEEGWRRSQRARWAWLLCARSVAWGAGWFQLSLLLRWEGGRDQHFDRIILVTLLKRSGREDQGGKTQGAFARE